MTTFLTSLLCVGEIPRWGGRILKPTLWAEPGSVISTGDPVTIWCEGTKETQIYFLYKEGSPASWFHQTPKDPGKKVMFSIASMEKHHAGQYRYDGFILTGADLNFSRSQKAQLLHTGQSQALFPLILVTSSTHGPFRCYGNYTNTSHVWSEASDPLEIHVSGKKVHIPTISQDHTVENLIRMGISALILTALGILLFEACRSQRMTQNSS
uniref:Leukocyte immunoglobulin-like receptor subfamily A member 5 n=1 Tax=Peromyscus maniculatus bairdii TaxID=230844 RepID=A0A8C8UAM8_PERMB